MVKLKLVRPKNHRPFYSSPLFTAEGGQTVLRALSCNHGHARVHGRPDSSIAGITTSLIGPWRTPAESEVLSGLKELDVPKVPLPAFSGTVPPR